MLPPGAFSVYDFLQERRNRLILLLGEIADDVFSGNNAGEISKIVHHRDKILIHGVAEQLFHTDGDPNGGIVVSTKKVTDVQLFQVLHGTDLPRLGVVGENLPEEIALADGAYILAAAGDDGNCRIAVVPHLFQSLAEGVVIVEIGDTVLGEQKISNVHCSASFLGGGGPPVVQWLPSIYNIQDASGNLVNNL